MLLCQTPACPKQTGFPLRVGAPTTSNSQVFTLRQVSSPCAFVPLSANSHNATSRDLGASAGGSGLLKVNEINSLQPPCRQRRPPGSPAVPPLTLTHAPYSSEQLMEEFPWVHPQMTWPSPYSPDPWSQRDRRGSSRKESWSGGTQTRQGTMRCPHPRDAAPETHPRCGPTRPPQSHPRRGGCGLPVHSGVTPTGSTFKYLFLS